MKPPDSILNWCGGFFDGEGCVELYNGLKVSVGQRDPSPLETFQEIFGGRIRQRPDGNHQWYLIGEGASQFLEILIPHMIYKRDQAELAIEWWSLGPGKPSIHTTPENRIRRREIAQVVKSMKRPWMFCSDE